jgi:hypothetical protein
MSNPLDERKKALEEDYFRRKEREVIEKLRARMDAEKEAGDAAAAAHHCPKCDGKLVEVAFEGVQIDICDKCGGAWLDSGELEALTKKDSGGWLSRLWGSSASE